MTILEPSFETVSNWTFSTECDVHFHLGGTECSGSTSGQSSDWASDGAKSFKGYVKMAGADGWSKAIASQSGINFSNFEGIRFDWKVDGFGKAGTGYNHMWRLYIYKDDYQLKQITFQYEDSGSTGTEEVDCSEVSGTGTLKIVAQVYINSTSETDCVEGTFYVDNIVCIGLKTLKTSDSNSRLTIAQDKSVSGSAYIEPVGYTSYDAKSDIIIQQEKNIIGKSRISIHQEKNITGNAYILFDYTAPERIVIETSDPVAPLRSAGVGDLVTVNDPESGLSGTYRIYGKELRNDSGLLTLSYELSNTQLSVMGEIKKSADETAKLSKYMQGATNIFVVNETENAESGTSPPGPIDLFFRIPSDAVAINSVKLSYRNEAPRIWSDTSANNPGSNPVNQAYASVTSASFSSKTWTDVGSSFSPANDEEAHAFLISVRCDTQNVGSTWHKVRIYNSTDSEYYPTSDGVGVILDSNDSKNESNTAFIYIPKNLKGKTLKVQFYNNYSSSAYFTFFRTDWGLSQHSHIINYDIATKSYTTTDIRIFTSDDASGTPTWTERTSEIETMLTRSLRANENESENDIDLTEFFSSTGWKGIRIVTDGNSRHKAQVQVKCFVQSRI